MYIYTIEANDTQDFEQKLKDWNNQYGRKVRIVSMAQSEVASGLDWHITLTIAVEWL